MTKSIAARLSQMRNTKTIAQTVTETNSHTATLKGQFKTTTRKGRRRRKEKKLKQSSTQNEAQTACSDLDPVPCFHDTQWLHDVL